MQLWGLDAPAAAFVWALAYASFMDIPMVTGGPMLLLVALVWLIAISSRLYSAVRLRRGWYLQFYQKNLAPLLLLMLAVTAATLWMLFFHVGQLFVVYASKPLLFTLVGFIPFVSRVEPARAFFHATAFAWACTVPALFFSVVVAPLELWFFAPTWYLSVSMFLYYLVRSSWQMEEDAARRRGFVVRVGLLLLFASCLFSAQNASELERSLCLTIATGTACLELLVRLRPRLRQDTLFSLGWLAIALPPVLGMLVFHS